MITGQKVIEGVIRESRLSWDSATPTEIQNAWQLADALDTCLTLISLASNLLGSVNIKSRPVCLILVSFLKSFIQIHLN